MKHLTSTEIQSKVSETEKGLTGEPLTLWRLIKITPAEWSIENKEHWVVAIAGSLVIWYDEAENEFVCSVYVSFGRIEGENQTGKIAQSDVPDNMLSLLSALRASAGK